MLPDLNEWKVYFNGVLVTGVKPMGVPTDRLKGSFYFDLLKTKVSFSVGDVIDIAMPIGTPIYRCRVTRLADKPEDTQTIQVQAAIVTVDTSGIKN